jgi:hypothetical protein
MKFLLVVAALVAANAMAAEPSSPPVQPQTQPGAEAPVRVAVVETQAAEASLPVRKLPAPQGWLLLVAGLAFAGWVAHRRLSYL